MQKIAASAAIAAVMTSSAYAEKSGAFIGVDFGIASSNFVFESESYNAIQQNTNNTNNGNTSRPTQGAGTPPQQGNNPAQNQDIAEKEAELERIGLQILDKATETQKNELDRLSDSIYAALEKYDSLINSNDPNDIKTKDKAWDDYSNYQNELDSLLVKIDANLAQQYKDAKAALENAYAAADSAAQNPQPTPGPTQGAGTPPQQGNSLVAQVLEEKAAEFQRVQSEVFSQVTEDQKNEIERLRNIADESIGTYFRLVRSDNPQDVEDRANASVAFAKQDYELNAYLRQIDTELAGKYEIARQALLAAQFAAVEKGENWQPTGRSVLAAQANQVNASAANMIDSFADTIKYRSSNNFYYGIMGGYKWFFTENFGLRVYGTLNMGKNNLKNGASFNTTNIGANVDLLYNFLNMPQHSVGVFAGLNVGYAKYSGGVIDTFKKIGLDTSSSLNMGVNFGLRTIIANHHGIELVGRVGIYQTQSEKTITEHTTNYNGDFVTTSSSLKAYVEQKYSFGVRYVYNF